MPQALDTLAEPARLAALAARGLPDASPEASFDRLTRWAQRGLGAVGAYINFIDDAEHVFKSAAGMQPDDRAMPVSWSPCALVVRSGSTLAVEDVTTDPVLSTHPISRAGVRGYLAVPLTTREGLTLGTICVLDVKARSWSAEEIELLQELALVTMTEVELELSRTKAADSSARPGAWRGPIR